jgi:hypothetical protein
MSLEAKDRTLDGNPLADVKEIVTRREGTTDKVEEPVAKSSAPQE